MSISEITVRDQGEVLRLIVGRNYRGEKPPNVNRSPKKIYSEDPSTWLVTFVAITGIEYDAAKQTYTVHAGNDRRTFGRAQVLDVKHD